jgi:hypothetical protein
LLMPALAVGKSRLFAPVNQVGAWPEVVGWTLLGLLGTAAMVLTAGQLTGGTISWWLDARLGISGSSAELILYGGMIALTVAWLGLGRRARSSVLTPRILWIVGALWAVPLFLAAPVFSRDVYSYLAQGTILHLGHNPYHDQPVILGQLGQPHVLAAVDTFWQHTTAPYGPLFLALVSWIVGATGPHVVLDAQLIKLLGLVGLILIAICVPRLARALGHDPVRATWLAILNPLVLFALVTPGHNDLLMVGLMVAGVTLAVERRPLLGIAVCALAATIKLPALLAAAFIAVVWARSEPDLSEQIKRLVWAAIVTVVVLGVVTLIAGVGVSWVTGTLFSAPARVKLAITPSSGLACTVATVTSACTKSGIATLQTVFRGVFGALTILLVLELLRRSRPGNLVRYAGVALIALALGGPAAWPWYFVWGLALLAATPTGRTVGWSLVMIVAGAFVVKPSGILAVPLQSAPWVIGLYVCAALAAWYTLRPTGRRPAGGVTSLGQPDTGSGQTAAPPPESVLAK